MSAPPSSAMEGTFLILAILRRIPRKRFITSTSLHTALAQEGYKRDLRSIQRHLDAICTHFPVECDTRDKPYGYRWRAEASGLGLPMLAPAEALLMQLAQAEFGAMLPQHILASLAPLLNSAHWQLEHDTQAKPQRQWLRKVRRIPTSLPLLAPSLNPGVLEAVSDALFHEYKLDIRYRNAQGEIKEKRVWPLGLGQQGNRLYMVCRFDGYDNQRILALPRIEQASMTTERFAYPDDFDLARYDGEGRFAFGEGKAVRLHFMIDKTIGLHLTESPLSADQRVIEHPEAYEIHATVVESVLLHQWLRGWGEAVWDVRIEDIDARADTSH